MFQFGVPGGPELLIILILFAIAAFGLLAVLAVVGVVAFLLLRRGNEPDESARETVGGVDREPTNDAAAQTGDREAPAADTDRPSDGERGADR